jgi:hypothetical protein
MTSVIRLSTLRRCAVAVFVALVVSRMATPR